MKAKVLSVSKITLKDGNTINRIFAVLPDGTVGNFYSAFEFKIDDMVSFTISIDKECKFVVRPIIPR